MREVTERDFRMPEFRDAKPEEYEFRRDGKIVRKDRWERGILAIHAIVGPRGREFEIADVVVEVERLKGQWCEADPDDFPTPACKRIDVRLACGSVLVGCERVGECYRWTHGQSYGAADFGKAVIEWQESQGSATHA